MKIPTVSVLMPVRNGMPYLSDAIRSVLAQSMADLELLIIDDGSTDGSSALAAAFQDDRVRVLDSGGTGLVASLNLGLESARGEFIARMDSDDVCHPDRLIRQYDAAQANPEIGLICTDVAVIDDLGRQIGRESDRWPSQTYLREGLSYARRMRPIVHPTVFLRKSVLDRHGLAYRDFSYAEDRDLWLRMSSHTEMIRIPEALLQYRRHSKNVSATKAVDQETGSALAAINWLVHRQTRIDLFKDEPATFNSVRSAVREEILRDVMPLAEAFQEVRQHIHSRRFIKAATAMGLFHLRHRSMLPMNDAARRRTRRLITRIVSQTQIGLKADTWTP